MEFTQTERDRDKTSNGESEQREAGYLQKPLAGVEGANLRPVEERGVVQLPGGEDGAHVGRPSQGVVTHQEGHAVQAGQTGQHRDNMSAFMGTTRQLSWGQHVSFHGNNTSAFMGTTCQLSWEQHVSFHGLVTPSQNLERRLPEVFSNVFNHCKLLC